ncbi:MAG TPA: serine/threonine-protein kinase [Polyangia bacterium]|jgi:serine/threonine-protein kinase|nr:serine/threonine-protein kinase [Polyangia bacterium]
MVGKKINNYELRELVGDGAMGVVYLAEHPVLRRRVAVKLLKRQYLESPSLVSRFVNEARAAAAIHHPNVIEVIDVGLVEQEVPYIMMEYLDGEPLSRRLTRERLGVGKAMDIAIQAARAVAASHAMEIVHRDLKPENLFLVPDPMSAGGERVKVLDFGIAKLRPDWAGDDGPKTRTGVIFGTPAYMSPEQCRGLNDEVDATTDVYALGCILFEMLSGRAPYISQGWGDVLMMHMSDAIPIASAENPRVTPAIDHVIRKALAKSKTDRYPNMRDMHRALAQARNDVQDTPAPLRTSDPQLPAVVVGVDRLGGPSGAGAAHAQTQFAANDTALGQPGLAIRPRRRVTTLVVVGAFVVGGAGGLAVALRRPAEPTRVALPPTAPTVAPPAVAPPEVVAPREASKIADEDATKASDAEAKKAPTTMTTKMNTGPKAKSEKAKSKSATAKSHHRSERRKDPAKW